MGTYIKTCAEIKTVDGWEFLGNAFFLHLDALRALSVHGESACYFVFSVECMKHSAKAHDI